MDRWYALVARCPLNPITDSIQASRARLVLKKLLSKLHLDEYEQLYADTLHGLIDLFERSQIGNDTSVVVPEP